MRPPNSTGDGATSTLMASNNKVGSAMGTEWKDKEHK